eukprot:763268-Hanusia_phi.AAC.7
MRGGSTGGERGGGRERGEQGGERRDKEERRAGHIRGIQGATWSFRTPLPSWAEEFQGNGAFLKSIMLNEHSRKRRLAVTDRQTGSPGQ